MAIKGHGNRSFELLRVWGFTPALVEKFIPMGKFGVRQDLWGIIDVLAYPTKGRVIKDTGLWAIQMCSQSGYQEHVRKLLASEHTYNLMLANPWLRLEIWAWAKRLAKRGGTAKRWWLKRYRCFAYAPDHLEFVLVTEIGPQHKIHQKRKRLAKQRVV